MTLAKLSNAWMRLFTRYYFYSVMPQEANGLQVLAR